MLHLKLLQTINHAKSLRHWETPCNIHCGGKHITLTLLRCPATKQLTYKQCHTNK